MAKQKYWSRYYEEEVYLDDSDLYDLVEQYEMVCRDSGVRPEVTKKEWELLKVDQSAFDHVYFIVRESKER